MQNFHLWIATLANPTVSHSVSIRLYTSIFGKILNKNPMKIYTQLHFQSCFSLWDLSLWRKNSVNIKFWCVPGGLCWGRCNLLFYPPSDQQFDDCLIIMWSGLQSYALQSWNVPDIQHVAIPIWILDVTARRSYFHFIQNYRVAQEKVGKCFGISFKWPVRAHWARNMSQRSNPELKWVLVLTYFSFKCLQNCSHPVNV